MILIVLAALTLPSALWAADPAKEKAATEAAQKWLALVDQGKYAESWKASSELFRSAISSKDWEQTLLRASKPLGRMVSRKVLSATYTTSVPGAPEGEYVMVQFETDYENKPKAVETVTPMLEKDGKWRVSGYYIH
jgi:hypothetical protein